MKIKIEQVKELRDKTGVSIMQCKKALEEAEGDFEKALITLTKKSGEISAKKGDRALKSGIITVVEKDSTTVILELACETDFVAKNEDFKILAKKVGDSLIAGEEIETLTTEATQKFGERTELIRSEILEGDSSHYVHSNSSVGAVVLLEKKNPELARDIAMHITAQHPRYIAEEDIDEAERKKAKETLREEVLDKPEEMQEKILEGKLKAYFKERVLGTQSFIKNPDQSIESLLGDNKVVSFLRYGVGEE